MEQIISYPQLQELCRPGRRPRRATVVRWARQHGIAVIPHLSGGVFTTKAALDAAMGVRPEGASSVSYQVDELV